MTILVTIHQHQPLIWTVPALWTVSEKSLFLQYPRKARGQVTVAATVTAIMTNHCSSQWKKNFTQVKAGFLRDFSSIRCSFQPIKGSSFLSLQQALFFSFSHYYKQKYPPSPAKVFHSRNTLEVQPSFRNSLLNTVLYCKPQFGYLFYFTFRTSCCNLPPFWYQSQVWLGQL